jgi:cytoskeletal protein CcmA (bactofilin family)
MRAMGRARRSLLVGAVLVAAGASLGAAAPSDAEDRVVLSGDVVVRSGESVGEVVVFAGDVTVGGLVRGDVVVFSGRVNVSGQVSGDIVSFSGPVVLGANAQVGGSVRARGEITVKNGAEVGGFVGKGFPVTIRAPTVLSGRLTFWLATSFSVLALGLMLLWLAPRASDALQQVAADSRVASVVWGIGWLAGMPILACLLAVTILGLPFALGLILAFAFLYSLAYTWGIWVLGRWLLAAPRSRYLAFLLGWAIVRALSLVPYLDMVLWLLLVVAGLGAMWLATWRARKPVPSAVSAQPIVPGWDDQTLAP